MNPPRSLHKNGQLWERRIRDTSMPSTRVDSHFDSPHPAFQTSSSLLRNCVQAAMNNEYHDLLNVSNGCVTENGDEYHQRGRAGEVQGDVELWLLPDHAQCGSPDHSYGPNHLLKTMSPVIRVMKIFGFYGPSLDRETSLSSSPSSALTSPTNFPGRSRGESSRRNPSIRYFLLAIYALMAALFNLGLFVFNIVGIEDARSEYGLMNVVTMTNIISGMKPLHNAFNLVFIFWGAHYHGVLWRQLSEIDDTFRRHLSVHLDLRRAKFAFMIATCVCFMVPFVMRASEYFLLETAGEVLISDLSLIFVPLLSVWQLLPLYYYLIITSFIRWWLKKLRTKLQNDPDLVDRPLEFYYRLYLKLTRSISYLGAFFNPVAFFSLSTSVVVLCLTIYFLTNANQIITDDCNAPAAKKIESYFYLTWSCAHILVAMAYVLALCVAGWRTNEAAREIMAAVLTARPNDEQSRFRVVCFLHRNQTQWHWGVTVWRAFPVERSFLFTIHLFQLVSAISTYAVLLLKLQQKPCVCGYGTFSNETMQAR